MQIDARRTRLPILASAAPVVGYPIIGVAQELIVGLEVPLSPKRPNVESLDFESWAWNRATSRTSSAASRSSNVL
jgi:hypothetical protein